GRAAGFLHRLWFHQFGSREIWIIEVQLPFAVASDLWLLLFWRVLQQAPLYPRFVGGVRVRHAQCEVIHYAAGVWVVGIFYVLHEFKPVVAFGHAHIGPIFFGVRHASVPEFLEAENVTIEVVFSSAIFDDEADVNNVVGDPRGWQKFAEGFFVQRAGHVLHEFNVVAFGIFYVEAQV